MTQLDNPLWVTWAEKTWITGFDWNRWVGDVFFFIPAGYHTDLASIPRPLWWIPGFSPQELSLVAPTVHDWLYQHGGFNIDDKSTARVLTRKESDNVFRELMRESSVGWFRRNVAWLAVRCFGWFAWRKAEPVREA